jgi:hypothetical protein
VDRESSVSFAKKNDVTLSQKLHSPSTMQPTQIVSQFSHRLIGGLQGGLVNIVNRQQKNLFLFV